MHPDIVFHLCNALTLLVRGERVRDFPFIGSAWLSDTAQIDREQAKKFEELRREWESR